MISLDEIERSILELESKDTTFATCEKLSVLYNVRDHLMPKSEVRSNILAKSDLYYLVEGKPQGKVWEVMAELVDSIKVFQPKVYEELMRRLSDI